MLIKAALLRAAFFYADIVSVCKRTGINDKKTTDDKFLSTITGYDCKIRRVLKDGLEAICQEVEYNQKHPVLDNGEKK